MKTVSLRAFRDRLGTYGSEEPLTVVVRRAGELVTLGTWTPVNSRKEPQIDVVEGRLVERRPFTPAPKPGKR